MAIEKSAIMSLFSDDSKTVEYDKDIHKRLLEAEEELKSGAELKDAFIFLNEMRAKYAAK